VVGFDIDRVAQCMNGTVGERDINDAGVVTAKAADK
jgi:hypothetical protein